MATPADTLWEREAHTEAKHEMLRRYLDAWFPILLSSAYAREGATYVDAFAGPGEYLDQSEGSPLIALRSATQPRLAANDAERRFVFIEKRKDRCDHLRELLGRSGLVRPATRIETVHGECGAELMPTLARMGAQSGPIFVNFDGWGVDTPFELVRTFAQRQAAEVLVTFQQQWFTRFASLNEIEAGDAFFDGPTWRAVAGLPTTQKRSFLVRHYVDLVRDAGFEHVLTFELLDENNHELLLVYATSNSLGVQKMKEAMWKVDRVSGQRFRDPRDVDQMAFDVFGSEPDLSLLRRQLLSELEAGPRSLQDLKDFALLQTIYKDTHVPLAVDRLEADHKVTCERGRGHKNVTVELAPESLF